MTDIAGGAALLAPFASERAIRSVLQEMLLIVQAVRAL